MPPKSKFQQQREAATEQPAPVTTPTPVDDVEALASAHADAVEAAGLNAESYGSDDNTGKTDETNPHANELTYTDEESQALPDDPRIDPTFEPVAPPPAKGKAKGKGKAKEAPAPKVTVERNANLPATLANVAVAIADNKNFTVTALGLRVDGEPTFEDWAEYGQASGVMHNGLDWADYDWTRYGEEHFGESYTQWIESTGLAGQTLYNRMAALRKYTIDERVYGVSISAHVEVAGLDRIIRAGLLKEMQDGKIKSISELRERIKALKKGLDDKGDKEDTGNEDAGNEDDEDISNADWTQAGEFLYEHVGDGMLEPVLSGGKMPTELSKLVKTKGFKGTIKIAIFIPA